MSNKGRWRRAVAPIGAALLVAVSLLSWAPVSNAQTSAGQPVEGLKGFATAQDLHATVLDPSTPQNGTRVVNADEAWSGSAVDAGAAGLADAKLDEENRYFQPKEPGKLSFARGSGVEVGLGTTPADPNQVILAGLSEAAAPPPSKKDSDLLGPLSVDPLAYASATRGIAVANANESGLVPDVCVIGDDLARGTGYAADAQLVNTTSGTVAGGKLTTPLIATDAPDGTPRAVAQTISHNFLVPAGGNQFGLASEVRETIAPVSILANEQTGVETLTIEVLGEWVLRAVATGSAGGATVFYGPGTVNPETPVLRILPSSGNPTVLKLQDLLMNSGLDLPADPLIHVTLGENARALAKPGTEPVYGSKPTTKADGTLASGAVDVLRVYSQALGIDVRLGHMEVSAQVPEGGVSCPIPVVKTADPDNIRIREQPDTSHITMTVHNVYNCDLQSATLTDHIKQKEGDPDFQLTTADPTPDSPSLPTGNIRSADVVWSLGTIPKGTTKSVTLDLKSATTGGVIRDIAEAAGKLTNCTGSDVAGVKVGGLAIAGLDLSGLSVPVDVNVEIPRTGPEAKNTLAMGVGLVGLAIAGAIAMRRRSRLSRET